MKTKAFHSNFMQFWYGMFRKMLITFPKIVIKLDLTKNLLNDHMSIMQIST